VLPVHGQVFLLAGPATNALVQVGPEGVLVVDTMREQDADQLLAAIKKLAPGKTIRYVLNTHAHLDHVGGNQKISTAGTQLVGGNFAGQVTGDHAFIVAHEHVLNALSAPTGTQPALPFEAWPTDTFFQAEKDMYFNGEGIELLYQPNAHTDGDTLVYFRGSDVIAARVVPGRGRICDEFDVVEYRDMVTIVRDRVQAMIKKGLTLNQIKAARPTLDYEPRYGSTSGSWTTPMFIEAVYKNLGGR
jgi:glyoxylase-like metal-dependent hydrolase (beta-lactamase superfamily II)